MKKAFLVLVGVLMVLLASSMVLGYSEESYVYVEDSGYYVYPSGGHIDGGEYCRLNPPGTASSCLKPSMYCADTSSPSYFYCNDPVSSSLQRYSASLDFDRAHVSRDEIFDSMSDTALLTFPIECDYGQQPSPPMGPKYPDVEKLRISVDGTGAYVLKDIGEFGCCDYVDVSELLDGLYFSYYQGSPALTRISVSLYEAYWVQYGVEAAECFLNHVSEGPDTDGRDDAYIATGAPYIRILWDDKAAHLECVAEGDCDLVAGEGANECTSDLACVTPVHKECVGTSCVEVSGSGPDLCYTNQACVDCIPSQADTSESMCHACTGSVIACNGISCWMETSEFADGPPFTETVYNDRCCKDDSSEYFGYFIAETDACDWVGGCTGNDLSDHACKINFLESVFNGQTYLTTAHPSFVPGNPVDIEDNGVPGAIPVYNGVGAWRDCDYTTMTCEDHCDYSMLMEGEDANIGEYGNGLGSASSCDPETQDCTECCGDDPGEYVASGNGFTRCCNNPTDVVDASGNCVAEPPPPTCTIPPQSNHFKITNTLGQTVAQFGSEGYLELAGQDMGSFVSAPLGTGIFAVQNSAGTVMFYIDQSGNLYRKGTKNENYAGSVSMLVSNNNVLAFQRASDNQYVSSITDGGAVYLVGCIAENVIFP